MSRFDLALGFVLGMVSLLLWRWAFGSGGTAEQLVPTFAAETPRLAVDVLLECSDEANRLVLQQRASPPVGVALLTGFVELGERVEQTAVRVVFETSGVAVRPDECAQFHTYSDHKRDVRTPHTVAVAMVCRARNCLPVHARAHELQLFERRSVPWQYVVFDHGVVLRDYFERRWPIWAWLKPKPFNSD